jgi:hypothetical protein
VQKKIYTPTAKGYFSGCGGMELGLQIEGVKLIQSLDLDRDFPIIVDPENKEALAPTCVAHYAKDLSIRLVKDKNFQNGLRPFTIREYARL